MKTRLYLSLLFSLFYLISYGQNSSFKITGTVTDTLNEPLIYATVLLLEKQDSTMVDFDPVQFDLEQFGSMKEVLLDAIRKHKNQPLVFSLIFKDIIMHHTLNAVNNRN